MPLPASLLARDALLAAALTVATQVELVVAADQVEGPRGLQHAAFAVITGAVAVRRRRPLVAAVLAAAGMAAQTLAGHAPVVGGFLALLVVAASLGYHASLRSGLVGLGTLAVSASLYDLVSNRFVLADLVGNLVIVCGAWGTARLLRSSTDRRVAAEVARDRFAREAVLAERTRIARDLHDSVAHALTLMTLQAGGAREHAHEDVTASALRSIEHEGRQALADMHRSLRLLGDVTAGREEAPGLRDLVDLVGRMETSGLTVRVSTVGDVSALPGSVSSAAYRVVQEALLNTIKHSDATEATVEVVRSDDELAIRVEDNGGRRNETRLQAGSALGLSSLRERLALFDGRLTAAPGEASGWLLRAAIPLKG